MTIGLWITLLLHRARRKDLVELHQPRGEALLERHLRGRLQDFAVRLDAMAEHRLARERGTGIASVEP